MSLAVKICGLSTPETVDEAVRQGARYLGFVFVEKSPRFISADIAWQLASRSGSALRNVGLFVDPSDQMLMDITSQVPLDFIQLHGTESLQRIKDIKALIPHRIIKAISIAHQDDLKKIDAYRGLVDMILLDAKPADSGVHILPGGNGQAFDWSVLEGYDWRGQPWMLSGGLNASNIEQAVTATKARAVDLSSGLEDRPGHKTVAKIKEFMASVRHLG